MKKNKAKHLFNFIVCGVAVIFMILAVLMVTSPNFPHLQDEMPENFENLSLDNILTEEYFNKYPNQTFNLVFGDKEYRFNKNSGNSIEKLKEELYIEPIDAKVIFNPNSEEVFIFQDEVVGQELDTDNLTLYLKNSIKNKTTENIVIPTNAVAPKQTKQQLENGITLRSEFSTSIVGSQAGRKHNVSYGLSAFNGMIVLPDEEVSFNKVTGDRNFDSNYQDATVIMNGEYVQGKGGGVCQASTTLYNALIRADVEILEVHNHSLPVKYVPLAFDAMVNDTTSDLVFKNNTGSPLYILTSATDEKVTVKIFGAPLEDGLKIDTRTEKIREIKKGDKIIPDTEGKYSKYVTFKGEYYRVKYPQNGQECVGYLLYYKNGELVNEKKVRHVYYQGQDGIIIEGTEDVYEGVTLPTNTVNFITGN